MIERIISRGLDAPAKFAPTLEVRRGNARGTVEASKLRKGKSVYNPWTHISHKELIYLLQKFISPRSKALLRMHLGEGLVGVNHRAIPTATHKEGNQKSPPCNKFVTQLLPYVHATGLANLNTSISQFHN